MNATVVPKHTIEVSEESGVRYLHFGTEWIQGAMRIARPWALELDYTREMMAALLLRPGADWPANALIIGLGAGSVTKFLYRHRPQAKLDLVEINPEVVAVARHAFRVPDDNARLTVHRADGVAFVRNARTRYDCILVDGFDHRARPGTTLERQRTTGYITEAVMTEHARAAGFVLEATSEVNANPQDTHDHPQGVW